MKKMTQCFYLQFHCKICDVNGTKQRTLIKEKRIY
jgi:hypothetical protein